MGLTNASKPHWLDELLPPAARRQTADSGTYRSRLPMTTADTYPPRARSHSAPKPRGSPSKVAAAAGTRPATASTRGTGKR
jgi:hypothetical protein